VFPSCCACEIRWWGGFLSVYAKNPHHLIYGSSHYAVQEYVSIYIYILLDLHFFRGLAVDHFAALDQLQKVRYIARNIFSMHPLSTTREKRCQYSAPCPLGNFSDTSVKSTIESELRRGSTYRQLHFKVRVMLTLFWDTKWSCWISRNWTWALMYELITKPLRAAVFNLFLFSSPQM
jgi:hypothetical protein